MCSIIGCYSKDQISNILVKGLKRMEYRGYDSVGLATKHSDKILIKKGVGKVNDVNEQIQLDSLPGHVGIGHTRWATHGGVTKNNAHPHLCADSSVAVVHNGIIENHLDLKHELQHDGINFNSQTDTEVIPNLFGKYFKELNDTKAAMMKTVSRLEGQYSFVVMLENGTIAAAKYHEPLILGIGKHEYFVSSDVLGFIEYTDKAVFLENEQFVIIDESGYRIFDFNGNLCKYSITKISTKLTDTIKGNYDHYTIKEIYEQPKTILSAGKESENEFKQFSNTLNNVNEIYVTGSGTSYNAGLVAKYLFPKYVGRKIEPIMSSEVKFSEYMIQPHSALIALSQSGESADVLEAVNIAKSKNAKILSIVNSETSSLAQESDHVIPLNCGPEIGVAATKSFTSQLAILYRLTATLSIENISLDFNLISDTITNILSKQSKLIEISDELKKASDIYVLGRGIHYPIAKEGALKIKELTYIHAEGVAAGELKHGPLALMDSSAFVIVLHPNDETYMDNLSSIHEIKARGAKVIGISDKEDDVYDYWIEIPKVDEFLYPLIEIVPFQLLAYYTTIGKGADPDYPRNLAKCVTVK